MQIHALRACSLLVIPPPKERVPPPGGFPTDLSDLNLSSWAGLVQDVTSGLLALPPNLGSDMGLPAVALLELLEKATGWGYCHYCCHLGSRCICMGAYSPAPPPPWNQVVDQSPGYRATTSSGGMTAPSTTAAGMSGYIPPPPGLPPINFSNWRLPPPEALASRGLPTAPPSLPGVGRSVNLRGMAKRIAGAQMVQHPGGLAQRMPTPPTPPPCMPKMAPPLHQPPPGLPATSVLCTPQMAPPLRQPPPGWLAMLYQQAVQLPKKPAGRGVAADAPTDKAAPWAARVHRTTEDLASEGGEVAANPSVTPEVCWGRRVRSHCVRRAICPPGRHPVSHHHQHLKEPSLSGEVSQGPPSVIPHGWQQIFVAVVGGRTWSISSRSTTSSALPPLGRQNGQGLRSSSLTTSSSIRRKPWPSRRPIQWTLWPTSRTSSIRPLASTWMAS